LRAVATLCEGSSPGLLLPAFIGFDTNREQRNAKSYHRRKQKDPPMQCCFISEILQAIYSITQ
jgi:hypothetical protein